MSRAHTSVGRGRRVLWTVIQPSGDVCVVDKSLRWRCAGRLRYLELIAGGFRDNLNV